ncbi:MAG: hypothetical protein ACRD0I_06530 [Acidimicrobiales bacterium]
MEPSRPSGGELSQTTTIGLGLDMVASKMKIGLDGPERWHP